MGLKIGSNVLSGLKISGDILDGAKIGSDVAYRKPAVDDRSLTAQQFYDNVIADSRGLYALVFMTERDSVSGDEFDRKGAVTFGSVLFDSRPTSGFTVLSTIGTAEVGVFDVTRTFANNGLEAVIERLDTDSSFVVGNVATQVIGIFNITTGEYIQATPNLLSGESGNISITIRYTDDDEPTDSDYTDWKAWYLNGSAGTGTPSATDILNFANNINRVEGNDVLAWVVYTDDANVAALDPYGDFPAAAETPAQAANRIFSALGIAGGHVADVTFGTHDRIKWQYSSTHGETHNQYPADMFTNDAVFRMHRLRVSGSPLSINVWRGSVSTYSYIDASTPLVSANWFYVINCDDREWIAMPISGLQTLEASSFAFTNNIDISTIRTNATVTQVTSFVDALDEKRVILAVSDQATYNPFA